jgi:hypothetical protein
VSQRTRDGERLVKQVFGGSLYDTGRGFYVSLEFLAIVRGSMAAGGQALSPAQDQAPHFLRRSHDFARRLVDGSTECDNAEVTTTLRALLRGLRVPVPGRRAGASPNWASEHFYPYVGDLVHYDAVMRRGHVAVERYNYRGAGGLAHRIVRSDPERDRLDQTRTALVALLGNSDSALGKIARALSARDSAPSSETEEPWSDEMEREAVIKSSPWVEHLRAGLHRIVLRHETPDAERIEAIMHWIPLCIAMHQACVARERTGSPARPIPVDFRAGNNAIRQLAREASALVRSDVYTALELAADSESKPELLRGSQKWRSGPRTFVSTTLGSVGALNGTKGETFFKFGPALTQALILAMLDTEMEFERFCVEVMFQRLGFVVDADSAKQTTLSDNVDLAEFERNARAFAGFLRDLGLIQDYSDATRMVRTQRW